MPLNLQIQSETTVIPPSVNSLNENAFPALRSTQDELHFQSASDEESTEEDPNDNEYQPSSRSITLNSVIFCFLFSCF